MAIPRKALIIIAVAVVLAVVGVIVGVVVSNGASSSASTTDGTSSSSSTSSSSATTDSSRGTTMTSTKKSTSTGSGSSSITSDPTSVTYSLSAFAIGDWGTTVTQDSCCTRSSTYNDNDYDINAEDVVANLMDQQAGGADVAPKIIISHGDNFYWTGINSDGRDTRFTTTFEEKYDGDNIKSIPWVNVLGNHDYGGADYICSDSDDGTAACSDSDELVTALKNKFSWQSTYTSPNDNRWIQEDHFYVYSIEDADSGVSIDIFNVDSGDADTHGAQQTCCQCYGYAGDDDDTCDNVARGDDACCGGDTDMYDNCIAQFTEWSNDSRKQLAANIANSTATWKIVNSHYNPYAHLPKPACKGGLTLSTARTSICD